MNGFTAVLFILVMLGLLASARGSYGGYCPAEEVTPKGFPHPDGPYAWGIHTKDLLFTGEVYGIDYKTGKLVDGHVKEQFQQAMTNIGRIIEAAYGDWSCVVQLTVFLQDIRARPWVEEILKYFFKHKYPTLNLVQVCALAVENAHVSVQAIVALEGHKVHGYGHGGKGHGYGHGGGKGHGSGYSHGKGHESGYGYTKKTVYEKTSDYHKNDYHKPAPKYYKSLKNATTTTAKSAPTTTAAKAKPAAKPAAKPPATQ